jgi:hypothetical protein
VEGAGCFEAVYDDTQSWNVAQPARCAAAVDEIAPLESGGYLVTLRASDRTAEPGIHPYALRADGTVDALAPIDTGSTFVDARPAPDGLVLLTVGVATVERIARC